MRFKLSSEFGELRPTGEHKGIDIVMPKNTDLHSVGDGIVTKVFDGSTPIGKGIKIQMENGQEAIYGHMEKVKVEVGDFVQEGDLIGLSGNTGRVIGGNGGYHLHFAIKENGEFIDPISYYDNIVAMSSTGLGQKALDKINQFSGWVIGKEVEFVLMPLNNGIEHVFKSIVEALTVVMPDIGGYLTIACGILIMVTGRLGKWLGWYSIGLTGVLIWIGSTLKG
ncbi:M23 family metallopeptidase [Schinkia azotoformans]|uniref:M23 family metallopeptidase n=1 Tax=Schinkia azotoformans TaxID=1454 RepID=UPI002DBF9FEB|nr:M23 family metallopeptidase [Schinkia azotoformans]MEC1697774.1 M23 family metallopeptidase [Schinkia azotoformans]